MSVICYNIPSPLFLRKTDLFASDLRYVLPINRRLGPGALLEILRKGELPGSLENDIRYKTMIVKISTIPFGRRTPV